MEYVLEIKNPFYLQYVLADRMNNLWKDQVALTKLGSESNWIYADIDDLADVILQMVHQNDDLLHRLDRLFGK